MCLGMARELTLLIGSVGTLLGSFLVFFYTLEWLAYLCESGDHCIGIDANLATFGVIEIVGLFVGVAGVFTVKKHRILSGLFFVSAGIVPWVYTVGSLSPGLSWDNLIRSSLLFPWNLLFVSAGILSLLNLPRPYVEKDEFLRSLEQDRSISKENPA